MGSKQSGKQQGSCGVSYVQNLFLVWIILYSETNDHIYIFFLEVKIHLVGVENSHICGRA